MPNDGKLTNPTAFADGGYARDKLRGALNGNGDRAIEIIKRSDPQGLWAYRAAAWSSAPSPGSDDAAASKDWERSVESLTVWAFVASIRVMTRRLARYCCIS